MVEDDIDTNRRALDSSNPQRSRKNNQYASRTAPNVLEKKDKRDDATDNYHTQHLTSIGNLW